MDIAVLIQQPYASGNFPISDFIARIQKEDRCYRIGAVLAGNKAHVIRQMNWGMTWMADKRTEKAVQSMEMDRPNER